MSIALIFLSNFSFAENNPSLDKACFSLEGASGETTKVMEAVFNQLKSAGTLPAGFPVYSKTEIVGEFTKPHTIKAVPVISVKLADSILISKGKFITFAVWGLNTRPAPYTDFIYLLKEKDEYAIENGLEGFKQYKYIEVCYANLMPVTKEGFYGGDFSEADKIITLVRQGLLQTGCRKIECP
ncbi:MAG: hypothetical protein PHF11_06085 [Candidatus Omnitrophica bacterium]|nr:hypothetical protein [Candidatus Omnitrophota bacterium]